LKAEISFKAFASLHFFTVVNFLLFKQLSPARTDTVCLSSLTLVV